MFAAQRDQQFTFKCCYSNATSTNAMQQQPGSQEEKSLLMRIKAKNTLYICIDTDTFFKDKV